EPEVVADPVGHVAAGGEGERPIVDELIAAEEQRVHGVGGAGHGPEQVAGEVAVVVPDGVQVALAVDGDLVVEVGGAGLVVIGLHRRREGHSAVDGGGHADI